MGRRSILTVLSIVALLIWTVAAVRIANADTGREPGDPRIPTHMGSYSGTYNAPFTGASRAFPHGTGITLGRPVDEQVVDWKALHLARVARVAETKLENINFGFDKSEIEQQYETDLDFVSRLLIENPEVSLSLDGHTDAVGSEEYNAALADRRADAVLNALVERGVPVERLTAAGHGESQLLDFVTGPLRANRRVEVKVTVEVPTYLE